LPVRAPSPADAAVGFIALAGVAAETGVVMLIYLDQSWQENSARRHAEGQDPSAADLYAAIMEGDVERVGPKMMTVVAIMAGLLPIMWSSGTGSEVMSRIAAPMVGGMVSSTVLTQCVIPALLCVGQAVAVAARAGESAGAAVERGLTGESVRSAGHALCARGRHEKWLLGRPLPLL
jgi:Cu(I)/Ag(I) efflux system membrane protein CusA/SilA